MRSTQSLSLSLSLSIYLSLARKAIARVKRSIHSSVKSAMLEFILTRPVGENTGNLLVQALFHLPTLFTHKFPWVLFPKLTALFWLSLCSKSLWIFSWQSSWQEPSWVWYRHFSLLTYLCCLLLFCLLFTQPFIVCVPETVFQFWDHWNSAQGFHCFMIA